MQTRIIVGAFLIVTLMVSAGQVKAQEPEQLSPQIAQLKAQLDALEQKQAESAAKAAKTREQMQRDRAKIERLQADLVAQKEAQEMAELNSGLEASLTEKERLRIFGFFDVSYAKYFYPDDSVFRLDLPYSSTFVMSNINLYVQGQMTDNLGALIELRYSFMPHGNVNSQPTTYLMPGGAYVPAGGEFDRTNSIVKDPLTQMYFQQNGVTVERAHLTYSYSGWLNFLVGRYLTPFGIWNVDHGSPVLLMTRQPYMLTQGFVPLSQTGAQIFGRVFLEPRLSLDYAGTISNGRGPSESIVDIDENKAVGARLRLNWETSDLRASFGGHIYAGTYTDLTETTVVDVSDLTFSQQEDKTEQYDEVTLSTDLLVEYKGIRLQGEYAFRRISYDKPRLVTDQYKTYKAITPESERYQPNYATHSAYGLLAYELPWIPFGVRITPVVFGEYAQVDDTLPWHLELYAAGLNVRPSPFLVLKFEYLYGIAVDSRLPDSEFHRFVIQTAVSF